MKGRLFTLALVLTLSALISSGCVTPTPEPKAGLPNPASAYCEEQGYTLEMRTDEDGTYGVCVFPDGSECEEWAFYRGECGPGIEEVQPSDAPVVPTEPAVQVPDPARARDAALDYVFDRYGEVVFPPPGSDWAEEDVTEEGLVGASTFRYTAADLVVTVSFPVVNPADAIYQVAVSDEGTGFRWGGLVDATGQVTELSEPDAQAQPLAVAWYGYVASTPEGGQFDDYLVLLPEEARRAVGIEGADETVEAEIVALRDREEPGKYAHFWGTLDCDVPDYGGCQLLVTHLRVDGPGPFFDPDPVDAWQGTVVSGPPGPRSGGDDYLEVLVGGIPMQYGIGSADAAVAAQLERLRDTGTIIRVWGQVSAGVIDWNGTQIEVDRLEIAAESPAAPVGYEGWKPYLNAAFGYALWYPGDCQVMGANLNQSVQFSGPLVEGEHSPLLTVSHYDSDFYRPPTGTDVGQWIADQEIPYDEIDTEVEIAGWPAVHLRYEAGPGWYASDAYYFVKDGQLFHILILHTGKYFYTIYFS
jgi:putative hemolysin